MAFQFDREAAARARQAMLDGVSSDPGLQEASQAVLGEGERSGLWIPAQEKTESAKEETVRATLRRAEEPAEKAEAAEDWWTGGGSWRALERETLPETGEGTVPRPLHEAGTEGLPQEENNGRRNRHGRGRTVSEIPAEKPEREVIPPSGIRREPPEEFPDPEREEAPARRSGRDRTGNAARNVFTGYTYDTQELREEQIPGKAERWMNSLFRGIPYTGDNAGMRFLLKPDKLGETGMRQAVLYGNIVEGWPSNGSKVTIRGRVSSGGMIIVRTMDLEQDPPVRVMIRHSLSAGAVRLLTLSAVGIIAGAAAWIAGFVQTPAAARLGESLTELLVWIILLLLFFLWIRRRLGFRGRRWRRR